MALPALQINRRQKCCTAQREGEKVSGFILGAHTPNCITPGVIGCERAVRAETRGGFPSPDFSPSSARYLYSFSSCCDLIFSPKQKADERKEVRNELFLPPPLPVIELFMQRRRRADAPPYARMAKTFAPAAYWDL